VASFQVAAEKPNFKKTLQIDIPILLLVKLFLLIIGPHTPTYVLAEFQLAPFAFSFIPCRPNGFVEVGLIFKPLRVPFCYSTPH